MAKQTINTGGALDSPTAESIASAFAKVNAMTLELFTTFSVGGRLAIDLDASPDTIRDAFVKTNTNLNALYTDQSLPSVPVINVGAALDDAAAESIYAAFTKVNTGMTALYDVTVPAPAGDYYVSTTGSDSNAGTLAAPFRTILKGASVLGPGKTLLVRGGTYVESNRNQIPSGTSWTAPVRIRNYPGETVWMRPTATAERVLEFYGTQQYIEIDGINIDGTNVKYDAVKINYHTTAAAHHIRFKNLQVIATTDASVSGLHHFGILMTGLVASAIGGNEISHCTFTGGTSAAIYSNTPDNVIEYCEFYGLAKAGCQFNNSNAGLDALPRNNTFRYNIVRDITRSNPVWDDENPVVGLSVYTGSGHKVYGNVFYNIRPTDGRSGSGLFIWTTATEVYNNTIYDTLTSGIETQARASTVTIRNNIVRQAGTAYINRGTNIVCSNNIGPVAASGWTNVDPLFVNAAADNFRLQAGSPAINAGATVAAVTTDLDGTARPQGGTYDIGAYEYVP